MAAQEFIDTGALLSPSFDLSLHDPSSAEPLTEEEQARKEQYLSEGFHDWSRRDFQQFVRTLETHGWYVSEIKWRVDVLHALQDGRL